MPEDLPAPIPCTHDCTNCPNNPVFCKFLNWINHDTTVDEDIVPYEAGKWRSLDWNFPRPDKQDIETSIWNFFQWIIYAYIQASGKDPDTCPDDFRRIGHDFAQAFRQITIDEAIKEIFADPPPGISIPWTEKERRDLQLFINDLLVIGLQDKEPDRQLLCRNFPLINRVIQVQNGYYLVHDKEKFYKALRIAYHVIMKNQFWDNWVSDIADRYAEIVDANPRLIKFSQCYTEIKQILESVWFPSNDTEGKVLKCLAA